MSVRFSTDRLHVRDLRPEDAHAVFAIWGDAEVLRHSGMDVIEDLVRAHAVVARLSGRCIHDGLGWWAVAPREGLGTEIARGCIQHARKALPRVPLVAVVDAANAASRRVLEKAGLRHVGATDYRGARKEKYELDAQQP